MGKEKKDIQEGKVDKLSFRRPGIEAQSIQVQGTTSAVRSTVFLSNTVSRSQAPFRNTKVAGSDESPLSITPWLRNYFKIS